MPKAPSLSARIRTLMRALGWSRTQLATAAGTGRQTVAHWLHDGKRGMKPEHGFAIADRSGFDARWILIGDSRPETDFPELVAEQNRHEQAVAGIVRAILQAQK